MATDNGVVLVSHASICSVNTDSQIMVTSPPLARLLIHVDTELTATKTRFQNTWERLRWIYSFDLGHTDLAPLKLRIKDLQGKSVFAIKSVEPLLDIPLPAGTYHIAAERGKVCRSYTMAIEPGTSFDLHLRLTSSLIDTTHNLHHEIQR